MCKSENKNKLLNLGCGTHYHPAWINVDFKSTLQDVIEADLLKGIPFDDKYFDAVYHSHLLEHLPRDTVAFFISECYRVLKEGGIIRIVTPDLEQIAKLYLFNLKRAIAGDKEAQQKYEWIMIELLDQMVRNHSGGQMLAYWKQNPMPAEEFVIERVGTQAIKSINHLRVKKANQNKTPKEKKLSAEEIGEFRLSGEVHQWMYDRYSLEKLLLTAQFSQIKICKANESMIPDFNTYLLDILPDKSIRKPDSLFIEAVK